MTSVMHDIFLLCTIFVHPSYFMKLTKISKHVSILFPLLGIPKKSYFFFHLSIIHCVPTMEHMLIGTKDNTGSRDMSSPRIESRAVHGVTSG